MSRRGAVEVQRGSVGLVNVLDVQLDQPHAQRYHAEVKKVRWLHGRARSRQEVSIVKWKPNVVPKISPSVEMP